MAHQERHSSRIWRTVVFAGAMLGAPLAVADPQPAPNAPAPPVETKPAPPQQKPADPSKDSKTASKPKPDPKAPAPKKRPRSSDTERPTGRGFVLS